VRAIYSARSLTGFGDELSAARAYGALAMLPLRVEILRLTLSRAEVSTAEVMSELGLTRNGALHHLRQLCTSGILSEQRCTHPRGSGPITYWTADRDELIALIESLLAHLLSVA
jgi:predicted ArsR family transcriptional regulator